MARNRSMRRMRNRSRNRSKRGGAWRMFQSEDMKEFTDILRTNDVIKDNYMDDNSANLSTLLRKHKTSEQLTRMKTILFGKDPDANPSFVELKQFWSKLTPEQKDKLKEELKKANKQFLYTGVVDILEEEQISPAAGENASSTVAEESGAALLSSSSGGKSRRRRRARRTNKKSRKSHKVRKSHRRKHRAVRR